MARDRRFRGMLLCVVTAVPIVGVSGCRENSSGVGRSLLSAARARNHGLQMRSIENEIVKLLREAPVLGGDLSTKEQRAKPFLRALNPICEHDPDVVRRALLVFVQETNNVRGGQDLEEISKVYVLNRMMFAVPGSAPIQDARFFGGWGGVPHDENTVNMRWPVNIATNGVFELEVRRFGSYNGAPYQAVAEFDYFRAKYGVRPRADH